MRPSHSLAVIVAATLAACAVRTGPNDGAAPPSDAPSTDAVDPPPSDGSAGGDAGSSSLCGSAPCSAGQICVRGRCAGCCDRPPECVPIPAGCSGALACGCFATNPCGGCNDCLSVEADGVRCGNCRCMCSAPWTPIDTPDGARPIGSLRVGDLVYSVDHGVRVAVPIARIHRTPVARHALVRVLLANGSVIEMSGGHPTADGRTFAALAPGGLLGDAPIVALETVPYAEPFTYDVLPASDTGTYFSAGAQVGSTLFARGGCGNSGDAR